jgi:prepilin signal peptidase PulO-like enzyme (type II secretory pathway)
MIWLVLVLLGLAFGSFTNALVWRFHEQGAKSKKQKVKNKDLSIWKGRSMCPHCRHQLEAIDLIPILSWISLKGKCRYCKNPISIQYPLVEAATGLLFIISYIYWPYSWTLAGSVLFVLWLATLVGFMALIVYDLRWMLLPNKIVAVLGVLAGLEVIVRTVVEGSVSTVLASLIGALVVGGLFYVLFVISGGRWIGGGDVKLGAVLGLLVTGPVKALLLIFIACWLGSLVGIGVILAQKSSLKKRIPFGPFLIIATILVYLAGATIISWYKIHLLYY